MEALGLDRLHGGDVEEVSRRYGLSCDDLIDFSANVNPLGPPPSALRSIERNLSKIGRYPDEECYELVRRLARHLSVGPDEIIVGNGATELIYLAANWRRPRRALVIAPTFSEYELAVRNVGGDVEHFPLSSDEGFAISVSGLADQLAEVDMVFLANPNNPTGTLLPPDEIAFLADRAKDEDVFLVIDEAFIDFVPRPRKSSVRSEARRRGNLFVIGSLTKFFALPGLRIGYGVGIRDVVRDLWVRKEPWSVNVLAQVASIASLEDRGYIARTRSLMRREKVFLFDGLLRIPGLRPYSSEANYFLVDVRGTGFTGGELRERLIPHGILIRDCGSFVGLDRYYIRVAVRTRTENSRLLQALREVVEYRPSPSAS